MTTEVLIKNIDGPENIVVQVVDEDAINVFGPETELTPGQEVKEYLHGNKTIMVWEGSIE